MIVLLVPVAALGTLPLPVETGISSPTVNVANWLLMTTREGFDSTLTVVTPCRASRIMCGFASLPMRRLKPGKAGLRNAPATPFTTEAGAPGGDDGTLRAGPRSAGRPSFLLWVKN